MTTKPYYSLSVGGKSITINYVKDAAEWVDVVDPEGKLAIAWVEQKKQKQPRKHYFLFYLGMLQSRS